MKNYLLCFIFLMSIFTTKAQNNNTQASMYNIMLGGITSSIGAAINKKSNEKLGKVMLKGFWQGSLGGAFVYGSKQMVYNFNKNNDLDKLWLSKIVNSAGISMIENASSNRNFYDKWHIHIGFNRIEIETKDKLKIKYKVLPTALIGAILSANNSKFNLKYSLQTLTPVFSNNKIKRARAKTNSILIYEENNQIERIIAHEFIHTLQYDDYMATNMFFDKKKTNWQKKYKFINKISKWIYMDVPIYYTFLGIYSLENPNRKCYFDNYFESEANFYSNRYLCN